MAERPSHATAEPRDRSARLGTLTMGAACALLVTAVNAAEGGYFPRSWGWIAVVLLVAVATVLVTSDRLVVPRLPLVFLIGITAFVTWVALSALWSESAARSIREIERDVVYLALAGVIVVWGQRVRPAAIFAGALAGGACITGYALATRLFPERLGTFDPVAGYRLAEPVGYWNGLGLLAAMTLVLGLGLAVRCESAAGRALAAATLVPSAAALYFTFSRGGWVALAIGAAAFGILDPWRLGLLARLPWLAALPAVAVLVSSRQEALTHVDTRLAAASREGHRLAIILVALTALQAGVAVAVARLAAHGRPSQKLLAVGNRALAVAALAAALVTLVGLGGPVGAAERARDAFVSRPPRISGDLNERLFNLSGAGRAAGWRVAWDVAREQPLVGAGAGTFEVAWLRDRRELLEIRDAHNLYLEVLAELGVVGLLLLVGTLALPLAAAWRCRSTRLVPAAGAAYAAYVAHAAFDWDWELVGVTLVAFLCAGGLLLAERGRAFSVGWVIRGAALAVLAGLTGFALMSLVGNRALAQSRERFAQDAMAASLVNGRLAERLLPWSIEPLGVVGAAEYNSGARERGRRTLRRAVARDSSDWLAWYRLALASRGRERAAAFERARRLNPLEPLLNAG